MSQWVCDLHALIYVQYMNHTYRVNQASGAPSATASRTGRWRYHHYTHSRKVAHIYELGNWQPEHSLQPHTNVNITVNNTSNNNNNATIDAQAIVDIPTKVISTTIKVQFTCTVSEIPLDRRCWYEISQIHHFKTKTRTNNCLLSASHY